MGFPTLLRQHLYIEPASRIPVSLYSWLYINRLIEERFNCIANALELHLSCTMCSWLYIDGLVQERRNSIANALELHLSCTNPSIYSRHPTPTNLFTPSSSPHDITLLTTPPSNPTSLSSGTINSNQGFAVAGCRQAGISHSLTQGSLLLFQEIL